MHLSVQTPRAHGLISEATIPTAKLNASTILGAVDEAPSELVGKAVVLTDGKAGTVEGVWLDELRQEQQVVIAGENVQGTELDEVEPTGRGRIVDVHGGHP